MRIVFFINLLVVVGLCHGQAVPNSARDGRHSKIYWNTNTIGIYPEKIPDERLNKLIKKEVLSASDYAALEVMLDDAGTFVSAHIALTIVTGYRLPVRNKKQRTKNEITGEFFEIEIPSFNGLYVRVGEDGLGFYEADQFWELRGLWKSYLRQQRQK